MTFIWLALIVFVLFIISPLLCLIMCIAAAILYALIVTDILH